MAPASLGPPGERGRALRAALSVHELRETEILILGSGVAGLSVALACSNAMAAERVTVLTKTTLLSGSSPAAQGGIAAAIGRGDDCREHAEDTLRAGRGLCDPEAVRILTEGAPAAIAHLRELGMRFDGDGSAPALAREGGHRRARVLHAGGDRTGAELMRALSQEIRRRPVRLEERAFGVDLLLESVGPGAQSDLHGRRVVGVYVLSEEPGRAPHRIAYLARNVVLATGGLGQIYRFTTNPPEVTGDGMAMAARAGAELVDLEFVQFHPTALLAGAAPGADSSLSSYETAPLLTEALRGAGALVIDERGERFLLARHRDGELLPRDLVARALFEHRLEGHHTFLDVRAIPDLGSRFPMLIETCARAGIDPRHEPIPVSPAAHYAVGGVAVDAWGRTTLPGLWACGETAAVGAHGANRLASNSLLDGLVFGARLGAALVAASASPCPRLLPRAVRVAGAEPRPPRSFGVAAASLASLRRHLRDLVWRDVGVERTAPGLLRAQGELEAIARQAPCSAAEVDSRSSGELRNLCLVAALVARSALAREESRGSHFRVDHPEADPKFARRLPVRLPWTRSREGELGPLVPTPELHHDSVARVS